MRELQLDLYNTPTTITSYIISRQEHKAFLLSISPLPPTISLFNSFDLLLQRVNCVNYSKFQKRFVILESVKKKPVQNLCETMQLYVCICDLLESRRKNWHFCTCSENGFIEKLFKLKAKLTENRAQRKFMWKENEKKCQNKTKQSETCAFDSSL